MSRSGWGSSALSLLFLGILEIVSPGLYEKERKAVRGVVAICSLLFLTGVLFGYFVIAPFSISFLAGYTLEGLEVSPTLDSYVTLYDHVHLRPGLFLKCPLWHIF